MPFVRRFKLRRRLRALQNAYYRGETKDETVIADYMHTLSRLRADNVPSTSDPKVRALHAGAGGHIMAGWFNADSIFDPALGLVADLAQSLPFRDGSLDYIHSEDFLEHLDLSAGKEFVGEAFRALRRGGVMRLLTPDLAALVESVYLRREHAHIRWCRAELGAEGPCESLNMHLRMNGEHRFVYDHEELVKILRSAGFETRRVAWNESPEPFLRYLDLRDFSLNLFVEARKP